MFEPRRDRGRPAVVVVLSILHFLHGLFIAGIIGIALAVAGDEERAQLMKGIGFTLFIIGLTVAIVWGSGRRELGLALCLVLLRGPSRPATAEHVDWSAGRRVIAGGSGLGRCLFFLSLSR